MRVARELPDFGPVGAERTTEDLVRSLDGRGFEVGAITACSACVYEGQEEVD